ncbi:MAG TPA: RES family NAD+ phosphorylase [Longimicrobiaceae bacterium]|nr:RES family NAD+ phosphorylase [Longimicrobiaceae bacterium]
MPIHLPADPPVVELAVQTVLWRVHPRDYDALWFGRTGRYRFDAPNGEYGVCYFGASLGAAILETVVRGRRVPTIPRAELDARVASKVVPSVDLRLLQLEGAGLPSFGLSAHEVTGPDYSGCRDLALRAWRQHSGVDGIQYRSRWDNTVCWAIFDRAAAKLNVLGNLWLGDSTVVVPALRPYKHVSVI